ncbi:leucine Rich repeat-containing domain protein [Ancylostoma ceylanicum]|uniref:Leucine Rich repeat-containing domain protein n=1 Tax=Ancylostoma ceylanicum TaxID=53326 RepID=A0A0D6LRL6_9BILA|nr:leucine Rich repeat-containing domain protein [Ancylostoma ceylanicum]
MSARRSSDCLFWPASSKPLRCTKLCFQTLVLSNNELQLSPDSFAGLSSLRELVLSANRLTYLPPSVFRSLKSLRTLNLANNKLLALPASLLSTVPQLRHLDASHNLLSDVSFLEAGQFSALRELETLNIADNLISDIYDGALFGMDNLTLLNMTNNQLVRLPGNTWPLPTLRSLDLSGNPFVALETASFDTLPSLQFLNLSNCRNLKTVHMAAFVSLTSLRTLDLSNCALNHIAPTAFQPFPPLTMLSLAGNRLETLPASMHLSTVAALDLTNNPWDCSCELRALQLPSTALCASPESLAGMALSDLDPCSILHGMVLPLILSVIVLFLIVVLVSILLMKKPAPHRSSLYHHQALINALSRKEYGFDQAGSPYCTSDESQDSAYESPTSAFLPRQQAPQRPPPSHLPPLVAPDGNYRILTNYPVPMTQL